MSFYSASQCLEKPDWFKHSAKFIFLFTCKYKLCNSEQETRSSLLGFQACDQPLVRCLLESLIGAQQSRNLKYRYQQHARALRNYSTEEGWFNCKIFINCFVLRCSLDLIHVHIHGLAALHHPSIHHCLHHGDDLCDHWGNTTRNTRLSQHVSNAELDDRRRTNA